MGVGQIGLSVEGFEAMTPAEFIMAWAGYASANMAKERSAWERTRTSTVMLVNIQLGEKDRLEARKVWPLPWDGDQEDIEEVQLTIQERRARADAIIKGG